MKMTRGRGRPNLDVVVEAGVATANAATGLQMGGSETGQEVEVEAGAQEESVIVSMSMSVKTDILVARLGDRKAKVQMIALGGKKAQGRAMARGDESPAWSGKMVLAYYDTQCVICSLLRRRQ
jgi:ribosomal protein S6E (S10)